MLRREFFLGFDQIFFWISLPEAEILAIKEELCYDILLNFALVTVQSCAVCMEMHRETITLQDKTIRWNSCSRNSRLPKIAKG